MRLELQLSPFDATIDGLRNASALADDLEIAGLWTMDHLQGTIHPPRQTVLECLLAMTVMAESTGTCRIGSLVVNAVSRHPVVLAQALAGLQQLATGRIVFGIGAGGGGGTYGSELDAVGLIDHPAKVRRQRTEEVIAITNHLWAGSTDPWHGELYQLAGGPGFMIPEPNPPLIIGGFGPKMASLAGRVADGFNTSATHPNLEQLVRVARTAAAEHGRTAFECSAFTVFDTVWLDPESDQRKRLDTAGVDALILTVHAPYDHDTIARIADAN